jgi:hypothetical protein
MPNTKYQISGSGFGIPSDFPNIAIQEPTWINQSCSSFFWLPNPRANTDLYPNYINTKDSVHRHEPERNKFFILYIQHFNYVHDIIKLQ